MVILECAYCHKDFPATRRDTKWCSNQCRHLAAAERAKQRICQHCGKGFRSQRRDRKFCSRPCANRSKWAAEHTRDCKQCGSPFVLRSATDANRRYCSKACEKKAITKKTKAWWEAHPEANAVYQGRYLAKNPSVWRDKGRRERL